MDHDFAGQMAALEAHIPEAGALALMTWGCAFQHIADDKVAVMLADPDWLRTFTAIQREIDARGLRLAFEQVYKEERERAERDPDLLAYRRQIKRQFN